jgi:hypothetical protein
MIDTLLPWIFGFALNWILGFIVVGILWVKSPSVQTWFEYIDRMGGSDFNNILCGLFARFYIPALWPAPLLMWYILIKRKQ